jgi:Response regulator containing CheY-like receiver domain and AraC-type DNA-binding domain
MVLFESLTETIFCDSDKSIISLFEKMYEEFKTKAPGYEELLRATLIELIIRTLCKICVYHSKSTSVIIQACLAYIDRNYTSDLSLSEFCHCHYYNLSYVSRKFKSELGITFSQYVQQVRIANWNPAFCKDPLP